jgi:hypothetical protein
MRRLTLLSFAAVVGGLVLAMAAVTPPDRGAHAQAPSPEETVAGAVEAWNSGDAEAFLGYFTPEALEQIVGIEPTVAAVEADMEETGPIASYEVSRLRIEGGGFTAIVDLQFEAGFSVYGRWSFEETDDGWVISGGEPASRPIPPGVPAVDITLQEYAFVYNEDAINAADGNFAFSVTNTGEEEHEIVLFEITTDAALGDVVDAIAASGEEEQPEGVGAIEFLGFFEPGQEGTAVPSAPLAAGRYGLICFIPAPDGTPHAFLGMVSEFRVGSGPVDGGTGGGPITPPSTGDAGLLDAGGTMSWLLFGLAFVLVLGGTAGLIRSRMASGA